jgi:hypothetical protein
MESVTQLGDVGLRTQRQQQQGSAQGICDVEYPPSRQLC